MRRLDRTSLGLLRGRGGYVLNVKGSVARIHSSSCALVAFINPDKPDGVYYAPSLEEAWGWLREGSREGIPCRLCLSQLTYSPRPRSLI